MKEQINKFLRSFGYEMRKGPLFISGMTVENDFFKKHLWLQNFSFKTIIDIGANRGQFASRFRLLFPLAKIYCFEPIPEVFNHLCELFKNDPNFKGFNLGLGEKPGTFDFFQNDFSDSSSLLPMKNLHKENFPFTQNEKLIKISVDTLDNLSAKSLELTGPILVKIDVQGFEKMVILGGIDTIKKASVLILEVSFQELYENQVYFDTIYSMLKEMGFSFMGNYDQLHSPKDGSILQADAIFLNQAFQPNKAFNPTTVS
ncbi:FkbM family methyltransferase [Algoriphagus sp. A40]|uniref:FkbM family methyltransferase n=1 Tax=Algoriphagus sp. A40 TaxID=1945863 RepID=UPI00098672D5|nr:FkbM family methyltransferase [Algoriphagus sp. A40]OOG76163.1 hypothetical protein B0E43_08965 [Algoriphagus sp. A40]